MYSFETRIGYSQVGKDKKLTMFDLINIFQDAGCFQSEDIGFGLDYLMGVNQGWFVTGYDVHINRLPEMGEKVVATTYPYSLKGMLGNRAYTIATTDGEVLIYGDSLWILMDLAKQSPARIPAEMIEAYGADPKPDFSYNSLKLREAKNLFKVGQFSVHPLYIDTNGHMNNSFYIDVTRRYLPEDFTFGSFGINYKKPALLDDVLDVYVALLEGDFQVVLKKGGETYTIVEYRA